MTRSLPYPRRMRRCRLERLEDRALLCGDGNLAGAQEIGPSGVVIEKLADQQESSLFRVDIPEPGRLSIQTRSEGESALETRTSLLDAEGRVLIRSDARSTADGDDVVVQHLLTGAYFVKVEGLAGTGDFALVTQFEPATAPNEPLAVNFDRDYPFAVSPPYHVAGDFNGDGHLDIATPNTWTSDVSILLGLGDGSFQAARNFPVGGGPFGIAAADFNGDGRADVATVNQNSNDVSVLLATGDETLFAVELRGEKIHGIGSSAPVGVGGPSGAVSWGMTTGDFNGDQRPDLVFANLRTNDVSVRLGIGDGTFHPELRFAVGAGPNGVLTADLNRDGLLDVVTANFNDNTLSILPGNGDGTFQPEQRLRSGPNPSLPVAADFNADGRTDLAVANAGTDDIWVFPQRADGTFGNPTQLAAGTTPYGLVAIDLDQNGIVDLAASNRNSNDVSVLLGRGDGTFLAHERYRVGLQPWNLIAGDFDGDQRLDLSTANARSHDVSILLGLGSGRFQQDHTDSRQDETNPQGMVARDFNHDGILDLAAVTYVGHDLYVFIGRGDGTFHERMQFNVGSTPLELLTEDFNRDGHADLASINCDSGDLSVLLGRGDGTFQEQVRYPSSVSGEWGLAADFNADGNSDLVASGQFATGIAIVLGRGDGTFEERKFFALDEAPADGVAGDFNGDGRLDLATTNFFSPDHDVSIHLGRGDGTFHAPQHFAVGESPWGIVGGDFNHDGHLDLATANFRSQSVSLLLGRGDGAFHAETRLATGLLPDSLLTRDFDGDGHLDLVVSNAGDKNVSVLRGRGDGTFADHALFPVGDGPTPRRGLDAGDFNGDGRLDLAIPQVLSNDVAVLLGTPEAGFTGPLRFPVGLGPVAIASGDFSGDGRSDVASVNPKTNELTISLGAAGATLGNSQRFAVGIAPVALAQGDFNRDGRLDVAVANQGSDDLSILLGLGTGALRDETRIKVGDQPVAVVAGDFSGDSFVDLAVANAGTNDVSILLGHGDGTFQRTLRVESADLPQSLAMGDFNGDGQLDLATANYRSQDVSVFFGRGNGTFGAPLRLALGTSPVFLLADDIDGDGRLDLATANPLSHDVSLLRGRGDGTFAESVRFVAGQGPVRITSGDLDGDGRIDLATANSLSDDVTVLLARQDGTFAPPQSHSVGDYPAALLATDFNDDARLDLVVASHLASELIVLQGLGAAEFAPAGTISDPRPSTPLAADLTGDASTDVIVLNLSGQILLRESRPGAAGIFESPTIINPDPRFAARDVAVVTASGSTFLAALDAKSSSISFYSRQSDGTFQRTAGPSVPGTLPVAIEAGDISGDGRSDLVVAAAGSNNVLVYFQTESGTSAADGFGQRTADLTIDVGISPSAIKLANVDGDGRLDIIATNQFSGDVSVLLADDLSCDLRFRAASGLYSLIEREGTLMIRSLAAPADVAVGHLDADGHLDLVVANRGANSISYLPGSGHGGFVNPDRTRTYGTGLGPAVLATGHFNNDSSVDLAVLNEQSSDVSIYLGDGLGNFEETGPARRLSAGNRPSGLSVHDVNGDGRADLLVGNEFGDLLLLLGNGDGSFQPYERVGLNVALAVADLNGDGTDDFVFSSETRDRVTVRYSQPGQTFVQGRGEGVLAPGAVRSTDLNRDGLPDLVVANSGANNVLVYLGAGAGQFAPAQSYFAGTKPVEVTIYDLSEDGLPDLVVANEGSNDVSVLLGQQSTSGWTLVSGPRLRAGAGPVATAVQDANDDGILDILVSNRQAGNVALLAGVGQGFFDDRNPIVRPVSQPREIIPYESGSLILNPQGLMFFPDFVRSPGISISTGGSSPIAAVTGDFNFDGIGDLVVAHHDGIVSLLLGDRGGFSPGNPFTHPDVPHPVALAAVPLNNAFNLYVVNEGQESAVLLTTFGIPLVRTSFPLPPLITVLFLAGPATLVSADVLTTSEPSQPPADARIETNDPSVAPTDLAAGNRQAASTGERIGDDFDAPTGVIDLMIGAEDAIAESLRRSLSRPLAKEHVDRLFAAFDEHLGVWLTAVCDQVAHSHAGPLWDAVMTPFHVCATQINGTLWGWLRSLLESETPQTATETPECDRAAPVATAESPLSLDPWLAAVALAGLVAREWISPAAGSDSAKKISAPRARSRRSARPSI